MGGNVVSAATEAAHIGYDDDKQAPERHAGLTKAHVGLWCVG